MRSLLRILAVARLKPSRYTWEIAVVVQAFRPAVSGGPEGPHYIRAISQRALKAPTYNPSSEQQLRSELDLPRVEPGAGDDAERGRPQLVPRLVPDRTVRQVEGLDAKLEVLRTAQLETLVGRRIQTDDARPDQRVARHGAVAERPTRVGAIDEGVGVEIARAAAVAGGQLPVDSGEVGIADTAAVLDIARTAQNGEREAAL